MANDSGRGAGASEDEVLQMLVSLCKRLGLEMEVTARRMQLEYADTPNVSGLSHIGGDRG